MIELVFVDGSILISYIDGGLFRVVVENTGSVGSVLGGRREISSGFEGESVEVVDGELAVEVSESEDGGGGVDVEGRVDCRVGE